MKIQMLLYLVGYSLLYFMLTTIFYFYSMAAGYNGLALPFFGGGDDGQFYYDQAINFINGEPYVYTSIHIWILGIILKIFNTENVMVLRLFNYIASILIVVISLLTLKKITSNKATHHIAATILTVMLAIYPSLVLNSTLSIYRDVWIYAFFLWSMYLFINIFIKKGNFPIVINLILLIFTMGMLGGYRKYALLSFLIGSIAFLLFKVLNKKKISLVKVMVLLITGVAIFYTFLRNVKFPIIGLSFSDVLQYRQAGLEAGGSQMGISLDQGNILLFYINYFYSFVSNLIGPLPWQVTGGSTLMILITEGIVFAFISFYLLRKVKYFTNLELYLFIQAIVWFLLISISNDNFGTGSRLRIVGWLPLLIIFVKYFSEGIYLNKIKRIEIEKLVKKS